MKTRFLTFGIAMLMLASCSKEIDAVSDSPSVTVTVPDSTVHPPLANFVKYTIKLGEQFCDKNGYLPVKYSELAFKVKFDSSSIYQTVSPSNQNDINKLYGFSDNNAQHHQFSARFGWRWSNNALRLFAYTYNNAVVSMKELGTVALGAENDCSIKVDGSKYTFTLNGVSTDVARTSTTTQAEGYQLYPYFGGDEMAPHDINIWIKTPL